MPRYAIGFDKQFVFDKRFVSQNWYKVDKTLNAQLSTIQKRRSLYLIVKHTEL